MSRHWSCSQLDWLRWMSCHTTNSAWRSSRECSEEMSSTGERKKLLCWWNQHISVSVKHLTNYRVFFFCPHFKKFSVVGFQWTDTSFNVQKSIQFLKSASYSLNSNHIIWHFLGYSRKCQLNCSCYVLWPFFLCICLAPSLFSSSACSGIIVSGISQVRCPLHYPTRSVKAEIETHSTVCNWRKSLTGFILSWCKFRCGTLEGSGIASLMPAVCGLLW